MRIKKTSQYMEGGAGLSNEYGTSNENGYTQEYINSLTTDLFNIKPITLTYSTSGSSALINYENVGDWSNGIIILNGSLDGGDQMILSIIINYATRYVAQIVNVRATNCNTTQASLTNNNKTISLPSTGTVPTGLGTVKAVLIRLN